MSIRGKIVHILLRYRHLFSGKLCREMITKESSIQELRENTDRMALRLMKEIPGVQYLKSDYEPLYAEWVKVEKAEEEKLVLYFHGGGFVMGNAISHRNIVGKFLKRLGMNGLVFNYRLAPEHPAPAAVEDSADIYRWLLVKGFRSENIVFAGDSSGGGILLGTLLKLKDEGLPMPAVCAAFSPCTDMTMSGESHRTRKKADPCTPEGANETYLSYYVGDGDQKDPYASPIFGDLKGLPPMILQVGNDETLRDDTLMFSEKAKAAGVEIEAKVWRGMFHCFPLLAPMFPEATLALEESCSFILRKLNV